MAIEAVRALMPLLEQSAPAQAAQIRDALSQLQLAYVRLGGSPGAAGEPAPGTGGPGTTGPGVAGTDQPGPAPGPPRPGQPATEEPPAGDGGPAQRSGRLWVPGQER
jgi:hypothetical protein